MRVLITGATGFIGNYVIVELLKYNYEIIASGTDFKKAKAFSWFAQVEFVEFDFKSFDSKINYYDYFLQPTHLIHLAWQGLPNYNNLFHFEKNLSLQYNLLKNLVENGVRDVTVTGTCLEYGKQEGILREDMVTIPVNSYALAKDTLRKFLQELSKHHFFHLKWLRLFYMYGPGQNPSSIFSQLEQAIENKESHFNMSGGEQIRDYLPVDKVAEIIVKLTSVATQGIYNCCSGKPISVRKFVEDHLSERKSNILLNLGYYPYSDYEPFAFWGDDAKLTACIL